MRLIFDEPFEQEHNKWVHVVGFKFKEINFDDILNGGQIAWYEQTQAISLWASNVDFNESIAVVTDMLWGENERLIEYGFKTEMDAMIFKMKWGGYYHKLGIDLNEFYNDLPISPVRTM